MKKISNTHRRSPDAKALTRRLSLNAVSFDPETSTFSAVISSGSTVKRRDAYDGSVYFEVLAISPASVRLDRAKAGVVPLLNSHRSGSLDDQIGVVTDVRIENEQLVADIRLSPNTGGQAAAAAIAAGTPPNVSIGYQVHAFKEAVASRDAPPTLTATDWELLEVSLVSIPADPKTFIRSHKGSNMPINDTSEIEEDQEVATRGHQDDQVRTMSDRSAREAYDITARANLPADEMQRKLRDCVEWMAS